MGTNYYAHVNVCSKCKKPEDEIHIGKSSWGWVFNFAVDYEFGIACFKDWEKFLYKKGIIIKNEYGDKIGVLEFFDLVESKQNEPNNHGRLHPEHAYVDADGYSFMDCEFS